jgi:hypothetical protein
MTDECVSGVAVVSLDTALQLHDVIRVGSNADRFERMTGRGVECVH